MKRGILVAAAAASGLHLLLLTSIHEALLPLGGSGPGQGALQFHMVQAAPARPAGRNGFEVAAAAAVGTSPPSDPVSRALPAPAAQPSARAQPDAAGQGDGHEGYFRRSELSVVPAPLAPVIVPFPDGVRHPAKYTAILGLYIDESGAVQRVTVDGPALPPAFDDAARNAFLAARFHPGQRDGRPVRSMIRVEVTFDSTPVTP